MELLCLITPSNIITFSYFLFSESHLLFHTTIILPIVFNKFVMSGSTCGSGLPPSGNGNPQIPLMLVQSDNCNKLNNDSQPKFLFCLQLKTNLGKIPPKLSSSAGKVSRYNCFCACCTCSGVMFGFFIASSYLPFPLQ